MLRRIKSPRDTYSGNVVGLWASRNNSQLSLSLTNKNNQILPRHLSKTFLGVYERTLRRIRNIHNGGRQVKKIQRMRALRREDETIYNDAQALDRPTRTAAGSFQFSRSSASPIHALRCRAQSHQGLHTVIPLWHHPRLHLHLVVP